jgi:hypothetical protein
MKVNIMRNKHDNKLNKDFSPQVVYLDKKSLEDESLANNIRLNDKIQYSPLSGSEPQYEPKKWNNKPRIKAQHNCFSYAINDLSPSRTGKAQPGYFSGHSGVPDHDYKCKHFLKRLKKDMPSMYVSTLQHKCKKGFHKAFMALDDKSDPDYHFYRQDSNGFWSHKPGRTDVTDLDASKQKIVAPNKANRKYPYFNYKTPCFYFCVNSKLAKTHSSKPRGSKKGFNFDFF